MKSNYAFILIATFILAAGAYWYFFMGTGNDQPVVATTAASDAQIQFETLASQLPISFNTTIFTDARFNGLVDITTPVSPEASGRLDPLAPIAGVSTK